MTVEPVLDRSELRQMLEEGYGLEVASIDFLPIGADVRSFSYRCTTADGGSYYLKLRRAQPAEAEALAASVWVLQHVPGAIAPRLPLRHPEPWIDWDGFWVLLFPFVTGISGWTATLSLSQFEKIGQGIRVLHSLTLPPALDRIPREAFSSAFRLRARQYLDAEPRQDADEAALRFLGSLREHRPHLVDLIDRAQALSVELRRNPPPFVCCHGDLHSGNFLVDTSGTAHPLDWDTLSFAPKEKDLMFVGAGVGGMLDAPGAWEAFRCGYGPEPLHAGAWDYFRMERIVQDLVAYAEQLLDSPAGGNDRLVALGQWESQFERGGVVEVALHQEVSAFLADARLTRNTTGYSHATVDLVEKPAGRFYLKTQEKDGSNSLAHDVRVLRWLEGKVPAPRPILYSDGVREHLIVTEVEGEPAYADCYEVTGRPW